MFGIHDAEYHNYIVKSFNTDRHIIDEYKEIILQRDGYVFLTDFVTNLIPTQPIVIECNRQGKMYYFLSPIIEMINKILSIQQAFYELTCEAKLMPVNLAYTNSYIDSSISLQYITRSSNSTYTQTDKIEIPLLPNLQYMRVN